ncbi:MAG: sensor histidine kinase [Actinomycetota bacterium]
MVTGLRMGRRWEGLAWFSVWLVFLAYPIGDLVSGRIHGWPAVGAVLGLAAFIGLYEAVVWRLPWGTEPTPDPATLVLVGAFAVLTLGLVVGFGVNWIGCLIYVSVLLGAALPMRRALGAIVINAAVALGASQAFHVGASSLAFFTFMTAMIGVMVAGWRRMAVLVSELRAAQQEVARLAVSEERLRFARDLHDLLGHSLSLIVLKSELARRLLERDPGDAAAAAREVHEIETVGRQALIEVREAVTGYRTQRLTEELDRARAALSAAGIEPTVRLPPGSAGSAGPLLGPSAEAVLGWAVREGVTNVIRHSGARHCEIAVTAGPSSASVEIRDDGCGPGAAPPGSGLRGLEERLALAGGTIEAGTVRLGAGTVRLGAGPADGLARGSGFRLLATLPLPAPAVLPAPEVLPQ